MYMVIIDVHGDNFLPPVVSTDYLLFLLIHYDIYNLSYSNVGRRKC